jgi:hypothetical protein
MRIGSVSIPHDESGNQTRAIHESLRPTADPVFDEAGQVVDLSWAWRLTQNNIGPFGLGLHESFVHRGNRLLKLPADGAVIAPPRRNVPLEPAFEAEARRAMKKNAQVEQAAKSRPP